MKRYSSYKKRKALPLLLKIVLLLAGASGLSLLIYFGMSYLSNQVTVGPAQINVMELWNNGSYDEIIANGLEELKSRPLDPGTLIFSGFAYFHKGVAEVSVEKKTPLINQAIINLRKALLIPGVPLKPEIHYILGKAYFHKGKFFADLAIQYLQQAAQEGYSSSDMNEYLGLSFSLIAKYKEASEYFLKSVAKAPSDLLLWTLGQTYYQMSDMGSAVKYLEDAIAKTKDRGLEQKVRFLLGDIFTKTKDFDKAQAEYNTILDKNPNSADAHFYLGEIALAQGNKDQARAEWRKAFKIDPLHFNANQRLFN